MGWFKWYMENNSGYVQMVHNWKVWKTQEREHVPFLAHNVNLPKPMAS